MGQGPRKSYDGRGKALATRPKKYQWSPRLRNSGILFRYWKLGLRELTPNEEYSTTFEGWERRIQEFDASFTLRKSGKNETMHAKLFDRFKRQQLRPVSNATKNC
jgi:hypothetical protein